MVRFIFEQPLFLVHWNACILCYIFRKRKNAPIRIHNLPDRPCMKTKSLDFSKQCHHLHSDSWLHYNARLHTISIEETCVLLHKLIHHTDQESIHIVGLTSHSTKMHHKTYKKQGFISLKFCTWMFKFIVQGSLLSFPLPAQQNHAYHNLLVILINVTPSLHKLKYADVNYDALFERQCYFL